MTRPSVHADSGHRLGSSSPRSEGPADYRLVPPALVAWGTAALLGSPRAPVAAAVAGLFCAAAAASALILLRSARRRLGVRRAVAAAVTASLLCGAAAAGSAGLHGADLHRGPVPDLARQGATLTAQVTVTADPRRARPQVSGAVRAPAAVLVEAEATSVIPAGGGTVRTRTPVLLIVREKDGPPPAPGRPRTTEAWLDLLPSTGLRVRARATLPLTGADRVAAVLRVEGAGPPTVVRRAGALQRTAGDLRAGLRRATDGLTPDARAVLPGLVVGDTSRIPPDLDEAFRATGLTHLLAVSGANLTIVLFLLIGPPGLARLAERRGLAARLGIPLRTTALLGGLLTAAFVVVCRPQPSVLRAAGCGLVALLAVATGRRRSLIPALAATVLLLVLLDPGLGRSYGFLLSVLATASLLTLAPRWSAALRRRRIPERLAEPLAAAAAAQAVCGPVVAVLAARVSLVAVPCNLLAEAAVAPATVLGFLALATAPFALPVAKSLSWAAGWPVEWVASVARAGAALPGAETTWPSGWIGGLLLALASAAVVLTASRWIRRPWVCAACGLVLLLAVVRPVPLPRVVTGWPPAGWRLAVCDVGQGDALALSAGDGTAVVVDAGPEPALADRCLRALGVTRIPLVVLTHFHADHVAGLPGVLRGRAVGAIETTTLQEPPDQAEFVHRIAKAARVPVLRTEPGHRRLGPLTWSVLWPPATRPVPAPGPAPPLEANDASVTLLVRTAGITLLLLGDLEPAAQSALMTAVPDLPRVDVLKVAHHGSAYQDPGLLTRVRPRLALVSCGKGNPYGHPAPRTVEALRSGGAAVLRTDTDGPIAVTGGEGAPLAVTVGGSGASEREAPGRTATAVTPPRASPRTPQRTRPGPKPPACPRSRRRPATGRPRRRPRPPARPGRAAVPRPAGSGRPEPRPPPRRHRGRAGPVHVARRSPGHSAARGPPARTRVP